MSLPHLCTLHVPVLCFQEDVKHVALFCRSSGFVQHLIDPGPQEVPVVMPRTPLRSWLPIILARRGSHELCPGSHHVTPSRLRYSIKKTVFFLQLHPNLKGLTSSHSGVDMMTSKLVSCTF